ncbi:MAG: hypothetical protein ACR2GJ_00955 [Gemmatimonadaceae bacterium]
MKGALLAGGAFLSPRPSPPGPRRHLHRFGQRRVDSCPDIGAGYLDGNSFDLKDGRVPEIGTLGPSPEFVRYPECRPNGNLKVAVEPAHRGDQVQGGWRNLPLDSLPGLGHSFNPILG